MVFKQITTMEHLQCDVSCSGAVVRFGDYVFATDNNCNDIYKAAVYEFVETEADGFSYIECRLGLISESEYVFSDGGHALESCLAMVHEGGVE